MKKAYIYYFAVIIVSNLFGACNNEWEEELYTNMVSFKAPINSEGVSDIYMRYSKNGEIEYSLPVIISGSQPSQKDLNIKIGVDNDTLSILNWERFQKRTDLYFKQLPEQFFELPSGTFFIPKGSTTANYKIKFKFSNLDLVENWVLPLQIQEDPSYTPNYRKGWRKALLRIKPFNNYSGNYSATSMNIYFDGETSPPMVMSTRTAWVVDESAIFFYAGVTEEKSEERGMYKVVVQFGAPVQNADSTQSGALTVYAPNNTINFQLLNQPTYQIKRTPDPTHAYIIHEYCTLNIKYKYNDVTSIPGRPITYRAEGSMTMERIKNTLIPDEDQAIQW